MAFMACNGPPYEIGMGTAKVIGAGTAKVTGAGTAKVILAVALAAVMSSHGRGWRPPRGALDGTSSCPDPGTCQRI